MARGTQLQQLVESFRAEVRQSVQASVGTDSLPHVKQLLRRTQALLYEQYDWSFLRMMDRLTLSAGEIYYNVPANVNIDRVEEVVCIQDGQPVPIVRGIDFEDYAAFDSYDSAVRSDPVLKWDLRWTGTTTQIEVWPRPASNDIKLGFKSLRPLRALTNNSDPADLDDNLIVLFAAAEELMSREAKDAEMKLKLAQKHLTQLQANASASRETISLGLGGRKSGAPLRTVVRVR